MGGAVVAGIGSGVLAFGGVFIVLSIGTRMKNREWLRRAGPFEISERSLGQADDEYGFWHRAALVHWEEVDALRERLKQSDEVIANLRDLS